MLQMRYFVVLIKCVKTGVDIAKYNTMPASFTLRHDEIPFGFHTLNQVTQAKRERAGVRAGRKAPSLLCSCFAPCFALHEKTRILPERSRGPAPSLSSGGWACFPHSVSLLCPVTPLRAGIRTWRRSAVGDDVPSIFLTSFNGEEAQDAAGAAAQFERRCTGPAAGLPV